MRQLPADPSSPGLWFDYEKDTPVQPNREIRALGKQPMIKNGSVWCMTLAAGRKCTSATRIGFATLWLTCMLTGAGEPHRRFAIPRPTPFQLAVE